MHYGFGGKPWKWNQILVCSEQADSPNTQSSVTHKLTSAKALPPYRAQLYYLHKYKFKERKSASPNLQRYSQVLEIFRTLEIKGVAKSSFG